MTPVKVCCSICFCIFKQHFNSKSYQHQINVRHVTPLHLWLSISNSICLSCLSLLAYVFTLNSAKLFSFLLFIFMARSDLVPRDCISGGDGNVSGGFPCTSNVSASGITICLKNRKGSTKRTLFEIVVFKLNIFCFHVWERSLVLILRVFCVRRVYRGSIFFSLVLILRIRAYLGIKGDRFFSDLGFFFGAHFVYKLMYYNLYYMSNFMQNWMYQICM